MNPFHQQQHQQQPRVPPLSPHLFNILQNGGNQGSQQHIQPSQQPQRPSQLPQRLSQQTQRPMQQTQRPLQQTQRPLQQPQQSLQRHLNRSSQQHQIQQQQQQQQTSSTYMQRPRQPRATPPYSAVSGNLSRMLSNAIQGFPDAGNASSGLRMRVSPDAPPNNFPNNTNVNVNEAKNFAPNRYITHNDGSMVADSQLLQNYAQLVQQEYSQNRPNAPPSYPVQGVSAFQQRGMVSPNQFQQTFPNMTNRLGNFVPHQQQQQPSVFSQTLMRRLSGQQPMSETQPNNTEQRPPSFLMQHLQQQNNNNNGSKTTSNNSVTVDAAIASVGKRENVTNVTSPGNSQQTQLPKGLAVLNPLSDITDDLVNSPMSVASNKSDASNTSLSDLKIASLNSSHNSDGFYSPLMGDAKDLSPSFTKMLQNFNVDSFDKGDGIGDKEDEDDGKFIDAVLTGIMSEFSELDRAKGRNGSGTLEQVDINWLDSNLFDIFENEEEQQTNTAKESATVVKRSLSTPAEAMKARSPQNMKNNIKKSRLKSDSSLMRDNNRSTAHPYRRSSSTEEGVNPEKPATFKRRYSDTSKPINKNSPAHMYFENKDYFKFRAKFRDLIRRQVQAGILSPGQLPMKSSRLFLNLLTKSHEWVGDSVTSAVKSEKEINMKNFTKRKITIHNDITPEHIHSFSEVSHNQPFTYSNNEANGKTKPSDKLMKYLQQQQQQKQQRDHPLPPPNIPNIPSAQFLSKVSGVKRK